ncbi:hypothetical protein MUN74_07755 [Agromyces endophyticus]|uniref:hypothetical protein n=1 Tax=Agromyces sp. H17E-10 TaxID=2932244 RepID=UPI001FD1ED7B|nr:hypothetical protein [Agromyces sp. H17E-10]UOQ90785.1 hypothetical protein MUN74_07755 [Agromyces sp. H17E-10]
MIADDESEFAAFSYFDDVGTAVATFTELLGEPVVSELQSRGDGFTGTVYEWEGFALYDKVSSPEYPYWENFSVTAWAPTVDGLALRAAPGVGSSVGVVVGDRGNEIQTEEGWSSADSTAYTRIGIGEDLPPTDQIPGADGLNFGVFVYVDSATGVIASFGAPAANFGA